MVLVKFYLYFREIVGKEELKFEGIMTPVEVLNKLGERYPAFARVIQRNEYIILINGRPVSDKNLSRIKLLEDDILELLPLVSGG